MRLWPSTLLRRPRGSASSPPIVPMDPREQQLLDRQRAARERGPAKAVHEPIDDGRTLAELLAVLRQVARHAELSAEIVRKSGPSGSAEPIARSFDCIANRLNPAIDTLAARADGQRPNPEPKQ